MRLRTAHKRARYRRDVRIVQLSLEPMFKLMAHVMDRLVVEVLANPTGDIAQSFVREVNRRHGAPNPN